MNSNLRDSVRFNILDEIKIEKIHDASLKILGKTGVKIDDKKIRELLAENGAEIDNDRVFINSDMISEITSKDIDENIYDLVNALFNNDKTKLMEIYRDLNQINTNPIWILSSITNKFLEILHTKALLKMGYNQKDILKYFNISSGRAYYMKKNAEEVEEVLLEEYINQLYDLDYQIKSGKIDKKLGLELFLLKI